MDYDLHELRQKLQEMLVNLVDIRENIEILMDRLPLYSVDDVMEELRSKWQALPEKRDSNSSSTSTSPSNREEHGML